MASVSLAAHAQNDAASKPVIARCADWLKSTIAVAMKVDIAEFCSGAGQQQVPNLGGWHSVGHCGQSKAAADAKEPYCASSGVIGHDWAIAAGFKSAVSDGRDLMPENGYSAGAEAVLYTLTPVQIDQLHLAAGLYRFTLSHPPGGWKMTVAADSGKEIGTVSLRSADSLTYLGSELAIGVVHSGFRCKDPVNVHELTFTYAGSELYACMRPDHIPPVEGTVAKQ